ncbi:MAG TPA: hypothetical protein VIT22_04305 [Pseudoxanthomonas sp.]
MVRTILGLIVGAAVACLAFIGGYYANAEIYPPPSGLDLSTPEALAEFANAAPASALACFLAAWALAGLAGGWITAIIAGPHRRGAALVIGALLTAGVIVQATLVPNPEWVVVLAMLLPIPFAVVGSLLATPRTEF